jgi:TIR domain
MPRILISYRRADVRGLTGRISDRLVAAYGKGNVFRDIEHIPVGVDFRAYIRATVRSSDVLVVIIGPNWLSSPNGRNRIMEPDDPVRMEIETATQSDLTIVPILAEGAQMPAADSLPAELRDFTSLQAAQVDSGPDFQYQMNRMIKSLNTTLKERRQRAKAEEAKRRREAREQAKPVGSTGANAVASAAKMVAGTGPKLVALAKARNRAAVIAVVLVVMGAVCVVVGIFVLPGPFGSGVAATDLPPRLGTAVPAGFKPLTEDVPGLLRQSTCSPAGDDATIHFRILNDYSETANFDLSLTSTWLPWSQDWLRQRAHVRSGAIWEGSHRVKGLECSRPLYIQAGNVRFGDNNP